MTEVDADLVQEPRVARLVEPDVAIAQLETIGRELAALGNDHQAHTMLWRKYGSFSELRPDLIDLAESLRSLSLKVREARRALRDVRDGHIVDATDHCMALRRLSLTLVGWGGAEVALQRAAVHFELLERLRCQLEATAILRGSP